MSLLSRPADGDRIPLRTWFGFIMMCLGMFMAILDIQIVATSLPTIQGALKLRPEQMSWIQTAYLTAEVVAIPLTGFLTRALSMRWLFVAAVVLFTLASIGCAASGDFTTIVVFRVVQGFSGGTLIPAVFAAVFLLFPVRVEGLATTIAGVLAVLAPTVGPIVGGWITQTYSWRWLFLVNVLPGLIAATGAALALPRARMQVGLVRTLDLIALAAAALALTALEIGLKDAPSLGWLSPQVLALFAVSAASALVFVFRSLRSRTPIVELRTFGDRNFALGCVLSFALGTGLFGSVYLMPVFLAFVRGHGSLAIGQIMLVTGAAQLVMAPVAVALERRVDARILAFLGFAVFAVGLALSTFQSTATDFGPMVWPQLVRGAAIMFCLLPPTRLALGRLAPSAVPDASGLFNLMRNLGGAIGLALIDTVIYGRTPIHVAAIVSRLQAGDFDMARAVGIPLALFRQNIGRPPDPQTVAALRPLVQRLALTQAINEAWAMLAIFAVAALVAVVFAARDKPAAGDLPSPAEGLATA